MGGDPCLLSLSSIARKADQGREATSKVVDKFNEKKDDADELKLPVRDPSVGRRSRRIVNSVGSNL